MKRKFLILSAAVLTVCGAALLQSCSSEYEYYATEEYGYYTEEEIAAIEAMAEMYGLSLELNENYYGPKKSMIEHEEEMIGLSCLLGDYELIPTKTEDSKIVYKTKRKDTAYSRISTRSIEGSGTWSGSEDIKDFEISVEISWEGDGTLQGQKASGSVSVSKKDTNTGSSYSEGSIFCSFIGDTGIAFTGWASYYEGLSTKYSFTILGGNISTMEPSDGSFTVVGGSPREQNTKNS